jgi:DNA-binding transcriptional LysR family regulator
MAKTPSPTKPALSDVAVFLRVVEAGSFTAAADSLEVSKAAVSKYISRLEAALGSRLLQRTTRRLTLTEAGSAYYARAAAALGELDAANEALAALSGEPRGHLRVSAPGYLGALHLAPLLGGFLKTHPAITLDLDLSNRLVDLVQERFDVALRISAHADSSLVARAIAPCPTVICATPEYLVRRGTPRHPADLAEHECLIYGLMRTPHEWRMRKRGRSKGSGKGRWVVVPVKGALRCNDDIALKQWLLEGLGIRQFPRFFVENELKRGEVVELLPGWESPPLTISAVFATRQHLAPKVRAFVDFVAERLPPLLCPAPARS